MIMTNDSGMQVERYLAEVDSALAARNVEDSEEIVAGLREHIADAVADGRDRDEVLRELGDPQLIAASASLQSSQAETSSGAATTVRGKPWFSILALGLLSVGALLLIFLVPIVLVATGLVMVWLSKLWTVREKLWGTLLVPAPGLAIGIILGVTTSTQSCVTSSDGQDTQTICGSNEFNTGGVIVTIVLVAIALIGVAVTIKLARLALSRR